MNSHITKAWPTFFKNNGYVTKSCQVTLHIRHVFQHVNKRTLGLYSECYLQPQLSRSAKKDFCIPCAKHFIVGVILMKLPVVPVSFIWTYSTCFELKISKKVMRKLSSLIWQVTWNIKKKCCIFSFFGLTYPYTQPPTYLPTTQTSTL